MFNFLGACGCDQGTLESVRKLVEFTSRRSRNSKSGRFDEVADIGDSVACGRSLCSELRRYDAVCGQLWSKVMNPLKLHVRAALKGACRGLTHLMLLPLKRPLTIVNHNGPSKGQIPSGLLETPVGVR
jgi:hypothetical protein